MRDRRRALLRRGPGAGANWREVEARLRIMSSSGRNLGHIGEDRSIGVSGGSGCWGPTPPAAVRGAQTFLRQAGSRAGLQTAAVPW